MKAKTEYANTDFDLKSKAPFDSLYRELDELCCVLHYTHGDDGHWHSIVTCAHDEDSADRNAAKDILPMIDALQSILPASKVEFDACYFREFNIGFHCWDTWGYVHQLPFRIVQAVAEVGCSIAVTLYPMRNIDGTPKTTA